MALRNGVRKGVFFSTGLIGDDVPAQGEEDGEDSKDDEDDENPRRRAMRRNGPLYLPRIVIPGNRHGSLRSVTTTRPNSVPCGDV